MKLDFVTMNPAQNMTVFITNQVFREMQPSIAAKIMGHDSLGCDQVAFIEPASAMFQEKGIRWRMQMMGGEFCGNAARSFAALMVAQDYPGVIKKNNVYYADFEVSGLDDVISCTVERCGSAHTFNAKTMMPIPTFIKEVKLQDGYTAVLVEMPGIIHVIVNRQHFKCNQESFHYIVKAVGLDNKEAVGVMFHSLLENGADYVEPMVYIKATQTLVYERGCGSGSMALGACLALKKQRSLDKAIHQPGGIINVSIQYSEQGIKAAHINGPVTIVAEGVLYI